MAKMAARRRIKPVAKVITLPAPTGGWNRRDTLPDMDPKDAVQMDNIIPGNGAVGIRRGVASHATGMSSGGTYVESLMEWAGPASSKYFAAVPSAVYDVTSSGSVGAASISSMSNGRWQHTMFGTAAGNYLFMVNGANAARYYDGSSWTSPTINNVSSSALVNVAAHAARLWFAKNDSLDPWYLATNSVSGDATQLVIGPYCKLGGHLQAIGSWSRDGGSGPDDLIVFITSRGEVVVYSGTDPSSANTWSHVGVFKVPPPIGRRCIVKAGSDLAILTAVGVIPLSQVLSVGSSGQEMLAITDKINGAFREAFYTAGTGFGWQVIEYPREQLVFVNVPIAQRVTQYQFVLNVKTGAWTRFKGLNAGVWAMLGDRLYYGSNDGKVYKYGSGFLDPGNVTISATLQQAFTDCGVPGIKRFTNARPLIRSPDGYTPSIQLKIDYDTSLPSLPATSAATSPSPWDESIWDVNMWDTTSTPRAGWQAVNGVGNTASVAMTLSLSQDFTLNRTDLMFEPGGMF